MLSENDIQRVIDSIADNQAYLAFNMSPVTRIINTLKDSFHPLHPSPEAPQFSLQLQGTGRGGSKKASSAALFSSFSNLYGGYSSGFMGGGACLSHDHATQYRFVLQSFMLWKEIMCHMPKLWLLADADITKEMYRLVDTGQVCRLCYYYYYSIVMMMVFLIIMLCLCSMNCITLILPPQPFSLI